MKHLVTKSLVLEKVQKKIVDERKNNSIFHNFGHHHSSTADQASRAGLSYLGFGRYGGQDGKVSHIVKDKKLVPVAQSPGDVMKGAVRYDDSHVEKQLDDFHNKIKKGKAPAHEKDTLATLDRYYHDGGKFTAINDYLINKKEGPEHIDKRMHKRVKKLDTVISKSKLDRDTVIYTGMKEPVKSTGIYHSKGFRAGSLHPKDVYGASPDVVELHMNKGHKALFTNSKEALLPRGLKFRITGSPIKTKTNTIWKAEVVGI